MIALPLVANRWLQLPQEALPYMGLGHVVEEGKIHALTFVPLSAAVVVVLYLFKQLVAVSGSARSCPTRAPSLSHPDLWQKAVQRRLPEGDDALKFGECFVRATYYMLGFLCCWYIVATEDYWPETVNCWKGIYTT